DRPAQSPRRLLPVHGDADHGDARRRRRDVRAAGGGLRLRPAGRPHQRADRPRPALPAEGALHPRAARQPRLGRRRGLRRHLPRTAQRAAPAGQRRAAARAGRKADGAAARPRPSAVGDLPRRGPGAGTGGGDHQDPPRHGRRRRRRGHRHRHPRHHTRAADGARGRLAPGASAGSRLAGGRGPHRLRQAPDAGAGHGAHGRDRRPGDGGQAGRPGQRGPGVRRDDRPPGTGLAPQRAHRRAAPVRHGRHRPRRLQARPQGPRRHRQRRRPGDRRRRAARLAADPWGGGDPLHGDPRDGAGLRAVRDADGSGQPDLLLLRRPARGRGRSRDAAAPGQLRHAGAQGVRAVGRRRGARADVGLRAADDPLAGRAGGQQHDAPAVQPRGHQRPGPAVPAVRRRRPDADHVPRRPAGEGAGPVHRADLVRRRRLLRSERRPRRHAGRRRPRRSARGVARRAGRDRARTAAV
ncbi:MAG: Wax ester synthase/acyl-CoA:diacylglycerol acyltransferase; Diacyglycerol O-acyltransferase, partial [uncultured Frankineae bacterium]